MISFAVSIVVKATFTATLALIGAWLARNDRAAVRHLLLAAGDGECGGAIERHDQSD
jgi:hypothetical protein